jgi:hypothetical protein
MAFWNTVMAQGDVQYSKRLIPAIIDELATGDPERVCFSFPKTTNLHDGFRDISFRTVSEDCMICGYRMTDNVQFANAINKTAHFIQREIGRSSMFETVMYMGYPDVRHFVVLVAL